MTFSGRQTMWEIEVQIERLTKLQSRVLIAGSELEFFCPESVVAEIANSFHKTYPEKLVRETFLEFIRKGWFVDIKTVSTAKNKIVILQALTNEGRRIVSSIHRLSDTFPTQFRKLVRPSYSPTA